MAERPGLVLYFDLEPALKMLSDEEAGRLFKSVLEYAHYGVVPEFDGMVALAWTFIQPKIDRDNEAYRQKCETNAYNRYKGLCEQKGMTPLEKDEWLTSVYRPSLTKVDDGQRWSPTTTGTGTPTPTEPPNTSPTSSSTAAEGGKGKAEGVRGGREGKTDTLDEREFNNRRNKALAKMDGYWG